MLLSRHTRRREFIVGLGGAVAGPLAARAQLNDGVRRIGVLMLGDESGPVTQSFTGAFEQGLQKLGWTNGRNVRIEYRWAAAGDVERYGTFGAELVGQRPDALVAGGGPTLEVLATQSSRPIVFAMVADQLALGYVNSLARPGGNIAGFMAARRRWAANGLKCPRR